MTVSAILAHDDKYGIGKNGELPWPHNDADMKWFRECTNGHVVVMGRKTWESLGNKKLPKRTNIVVTHSEIEGSPDGKYFGDVSKLISMLKMEYPGLKIWIIGGADIYKQTLHLCDHIYLTHFKGNYECDTFVPMNEYLPGYCEMAKKEKNNLTFTIWKRIS
jgi:dihydrofolate reductase